MFQIVVIRSNGVDREILWQTWPTRAAAEQEAAHCRARWKGVEWIVEEVGKEPDDDKSWTIH
jgi:hypothetical protein